MTLCGICNSFMKMIFLLPQFFEAWRQKPSLYLPPDDYKRKITEIVDNYNPWKLE